jgi:DNA-binding response OmpR family regulator
MSSIKIFLLKKDFLVESFVNGQDALKQLKPHSFDMFVLDINTPGISGIELVKSIRATQSQSPIIIISAYSDIKHIEEAFAAGCNDYIKKPFTLRELEIRIQNTITAHSQKNIIKLSNFYSFDKSTEQLIYIDTPQKMPKKQRLLIKALATQKGQILDEETLRSYIWGEEEVDGSTFRSLVNRTRALLKEDIICTHRGVGYSI